MCRTTFLVIFWFGLRWFWSNKDYLCNTDLHPVLIDLIFVVLWLDDASNIKHPYIWNYFDVHLHDQGFVWLHTPDQNQDVNSFIVYLFI